MHLVTHPSPAPSTLDRAARQQLALAHLWLARCEARRFLGSGLCTDDLVSEGTLGLLRAAERFVPRGVPFAAYARPWVRGAIRAFVARSVAPAGEPVPAEGLADEGPSVEEALAQGQHGHRTRAWLAAHRARLDARERLILERRLLADDAAASTPELAAQLGLSAERVRQLERALLAKLRRWMARTPELSGARAC